LEFLRAILVGFRADVIGSAHRRGWGQARRRRATEQPAGIPCKTERRLWLGRRAASVIRSTACVNYSGQDGGDHALALVPFRFDRGLSLPCRQTLASRPEQNSTPARNCQKTECANRRGFLACLRLGQGLPFRWLAIISRTLHRRMVLPGLAAMRGAGI